MTRKADLPTLVAVRTAINDLTAATGKPPSAIALARHLGQPNTTFRRHFPDLTAELRQQRSLDPSAADPAAASRFDQLQRDNDDLRREKQDLGEHLDLAVANIQRLTLDNDRLRRELEAAGKVTRLDSRPRSSPS